ncbi:hypothetical protein H9P43_000235 [Blastocladiella emersonii ATCC 22665]|nr:hypothetical protein H9P43_000235 [Blastocladiella emersonii ATCC 22665]
MSVQPLPIILAVGCAVALVALRVYYTHKRRLAELAQHPHGVHLPSDPGGLGGDLQRRWSLFGYDSPSPSRSPSPSAASPTSATPLKRPSLDLNAKRVPASAFLSSSLRGGSSACATPTPSSAASPTIDSPTDPGTPAAAVPGFLRTAVQGTWVSILQYQQYTKAPTSPTSPSPTPSSPSPRSPGRSALPFATHHRPSGTAAVSPRRTSAGRESDSDSDDDTSTPRARAQLPSVVLQLPSPTGPATRSGVRQNAVAPAAAVRILIPGSTRHAAAPVAQPAKKAAAPPVRRAVVVARRAITIADVVEEDEEDVEDSSEALTRAGGER